MVEDSLTGEFSDEDEVADMDEDNHHREGVLRRVKVGHSLLGQESHFRLMMQR